MNLIYVGADLCTTMEPVMMVLGYVILGIKIIVPVLLILFGMLDLTKAVMEKDESKIKAAQMLFIKRLIAGILVFLVTTLVTVVLNLFAGESSWGGCTKCLDKPSTCSINNEIGGAGPDGTPE